MNLLTIRIKDIYQKSCKGIDKLIRVMVKVYKWGWCVGLKDWTRKCAYKYTSLYLIFHLAHRYRGI